MQLMKEKQDLTYLSWSVYRNSSGTAGSFLKAYSELGGKKTYYKLSNFDKARGVIGHECVNELIVDRLLTILGIPHLSYQLIHADVSVDGRTHEVYLCASEDFKAKSESKTALDAYKELEALPDESALDFCIRMGWEDYIYQMLVVDYLILNRDRHGANIEILRNPRTHSVRIAPFFDHGLSLLYSCMSDEAAEKFDIMEDKRCQNFIGGYSCFQNLELIKGEGDVFSNKLKESDRGIIFEGLETLLSDVFMDKIWNMIYERYQVYENL